MANTILNHLLIVFHYLSLLFYFVIIFDHIFSLIIIIIRILKHFLIN